MTHEGWKLAAMSAVDAAHAGEPEALDLLARLLTEQDAAKAALQGLGFGCTGRPWPKVIEDIKAYMHDMSCVEDMRGVS